MLRVCLGLLSGLLLTQTLPAGQAAFRAELIGGTLPELAAKSNAEVNLGNIDALILRSGHEEVVIPYGKINSLEYGQNVSRRYVAAVLISPVFLLSKSRKHFVTVGYTDNESRQQAGVSREQGRHSVGAGKSGSPYRPSRRISGRQCPQERPVVTS